MAFHWQHETWWYDLDGTFTGIGVNYKVTPWNELLSHNDCMNNSQIDAGWNRGAPAAICNENADFIRWAFNQPEPPSLKVGFDSYSFPLDSPVVECILIKLVENTVHSRLTWLQLCDELNMSRTAYITIGTAETG